MQTISVGDVYYLRSPFTSTVSQLHEKKLSYMLGTVSSRPAVVVRAPYHWDTYSTVTVLPSLSRGNPSIDCSSQDKYGFTNTTEYKFCPHTPHSVPVGRLGRYIGRLSEQELRDLLYAFEWIHDPFMQENESEYPIPDCYKAAFSMKVPTVEKETPVPITTITVDDNMILRAEQLHETVLTTPLDIDIEHSISPEAAPLIDELPEYHHDASKTEFPKSIFSIEDLRKYAHGFEIADCYYDGSPTMRIKRDPAVLTEEELYNIRGSSRSSYDWNLVMETYDKMSVFDAFMLGPRLPSTILKKLLQFHSREVYMLKKLCTTLKLMSNDEYNRRLKKLEEEKENANKKQEKESVYHLPQDNSINKSPEAIKRYVTELRPYLSDAKIMSIPKEFQEKFTVVPAYMIKQAYHGKKFKYYYMKALQKYEAAVKEKG